MDQLVSKPSGAMPVVARKQSIPNTSSLSDVVSSTAKAIPAATEIAKAPELPPLDPIGDLIKKCNEVANGQSVFKVANAHIFDALKVAYPSFLLIKDNETDHQRVIDALMAKGNRQRMPSLNKPALNATELACHPDNPDDWTKSSEWANVLVHADMETVSAEDFPAWIKDKSIRASKHKVRAAKKANKPLKTPFVEGDFPSLAHVFKHGDERTLQLVKNELANLDQRVGKTLAVPNIAVV